MFPVPSTGLSGTRGGDGSASYFLQLFDDRGYTLSPADTQRG